MGLDPSFRIFLPLPPPPRPFVLIFFRDRIVVVCLNIWVYVCLLRCKIFFSTFRGSKTRPLIYPSHISTVCLGSTRDLSLGFFMFMPDLACYQKVWSRAFYCPKMSL